MAHRFGPTIILLIFLFSLVANADKAPPESPYLIDEPKVATDTSYFNRKNKTVSFYFEGTFGNYNGRTINAAYFIQPDLQLMLEFSHLNPTGFWIWNGLAQAFAGYRETTTNDGVGLYLKYFMGNSFFVRGGASHSVVHHSRTYNATSNESFINGEVTYISVGIGNDWQWENFTFGFDWYKSHYPIGSQLNSRQDAPEDSTLSSRQDDYLDSRVNLIGMHLGASF